MALRKFSKYMKVISILVIVSFVLSAAYAGYSYLSVYFAHKKDVLLVVNGDKIYKQDFDFEVQQLKRNFESIETQRNVKTNIPDELIEEIALNSLVNNQLYKTIGRNLKIEVNSIDVRNKLNSIQEQYGGRDNFILAITRAGSNLTEFKESLRDSLVFEKIIEKLKLEIKPNDKQLEQIYNRYKYTVYESREFDEIRDELENQYYEQTLNPLIDSYIQKALVEANITTKDEKIAKLAEKIRTVEVSYENVNIYRYQMYSEYIGATFNLKKGYSEELLEKVRNHKLELLKKEYDKSKEAESKIGNELESVKAYDKLTEYNKIIMKNQYYYYHIVDNYVPSENEYIIWFELNKNRYDTPNTISGEIIGIHYTPTEKDYKDTDEKAKELIKEINVDNFSSKAKELSNDPGSRENGGDLGWNDIRAFVPEFQVALKYAPGSIIGPVRTKFGSHIIYVVEKDVNDANKIHLKHILLTPTASEQTKNKDIQLVKELVKDIQDKKVSWEDIAKDNSEKYVKFDIKEQFSKKEINSSLPVVGYDQQLMEQLFTVENGTFIEKDLGEAFIIIQKINEIPFKKATFEEFKDRMKIELGFKHANEQMNK